MKHVAKESEKAKIAAKTSIYQKFIWVTRTPYGISTAVNWRNPTQIAGLDHF
jgi:hypothetical protein